MRKEAFALLLLLLPLVLVTVGQASAAQWEQVENWTNYVRTPQWEQVENWVNYVYIGPAPPPEWVEVETWTNYIEILSPPVTFEFSSGVEKIWTYTNDSNLYEVEMSADGEYIAIGDYGGYVRLFHRGSNVPLWSDSLGGYIGSVSLTDNGDYIAAGSESGKVRFYDKNGNIIWTYTGDPYIRKKTVKVSGDGAFVTAGGHSSYNVHLFKGIGGNGIPIWSYNTGGYIREIAISEKTVDNRYFIASVGQDAKVYLFDNNSSTPKWSYTTGAMSFAVDISDNGKYIVAGSWDNRIYLFENSSSTPLWSYELTDNTYHTDKHMWFTVSISDDGQYIAAGIDEQEGWYYLFRRNDNVPIWSRNAFGHEVRDIKISGDGSRITGSGWDGQISSWTQSDNVPVWIYGDIISRPGAVAISGNGSLVAASEANRIHLLRDGSFAYNLKVEGQINPKRVLMYNPTFYFKLPDRRIENTVSYRIIVGENIQNENTLKWNYTPAAPVIGNDIYVIYSGSILSPYVTYQWRIRLEDNEGNLSSWSVTRTFEIVNLYDFSHYRTVSFTGNIPENYQVRVDIENKTGMNENQLLFYDPDYPNVGLSYWTENWDNGTVWVKVRDNSNIKLAYGNASVKNASDGDETFILFDDFSGTSMDFRKWTAGASTAQIPSIGGGEITLSGDKVIWSKNTYETDLALRIRANVASSSDNQYIGFVKHQPYSGDVATPSAHFWGKETNLIYLRTGLAGKAARTTSSAYVNYLGKYTIYNLKRIGGDNVELWANDDNLILSSSTNISTARIAIFVETYTTAGTMKIDWMFLRQTQAVEPVSTIGDELTWTPEWRNVETWINYVSTLKAWTEVETWTNYIDTFTLGWNEIETWTNDINSKVLEWVEIETWTNNLEAPVEVIPPPPSAEAGTWVIIIRIVGIVGLFGWAAWKFKNVEDPVSGLKAGAAVIIALIGIVLIWFIAGGIGAVLSDVI